MADPVLISGPMGWNKIVDCVNDMGIYDPSELILLQCLSMTILVCGCNLFLSGLSSLGNWIWINLKLLEDLSKDANNQNVSFLEENADSDFPSQ